jgi:hypothetical protein
MSKRIFINNLNTYVSQAIFQELRNDVSEEGEKNADANVIFGTYIDKDSSVKPDGIKKMLKVGLSLGLTVAALQAPPHHEVPLRVRPAGLRLALRQPQGRSPGA